MDTFLTVLKALAIMLLASLGAMSITFAINLLAGPGATSTTSSQSAVSVFVGVFLLTGAAFLYRAWFTRRR